MKADYATSDLISKVNSDWINAVLVNHDPDRADDRDDVAAGDITLQSDSGRQIIPMWPRPAAEVARGRGDHRRPDCAALSPPLGRAQDHRTDGARGHGSGRSLGGNPDGPGAGEFGRRRKPRTHRPKPATPVSTTEPRPAWLLPEILYGPAMASSPISAPRSGR